MSDYTRMLLVRPDMVHNNKGDVTSDDTVNTEKQYFDTQVLREKLSPEGALIEAILHLHKQAHKVLNNETLKSSDKLAHYDQLMTRSGIFTKKVKGIRPDGNIASSNSRLANAHENSRHSEESSDNDTEWEDALDVPPVAVQKPVQQLKKVQGEKASEKGMDAAILERIPRTYQHSARQLYRLLIEQGKGQLNWDKKGQLHIGDHIEQGSDIVELLADATRPKTKGRVPVGRKLFTRVVKKLNPKLKHVKNKAAFSQVARHRKVVETTHQQEGSGRQGKKDSKIIWRTRL